MKVLLQFESKVEKSNFIYDFKKNGNKRIHFLQMPNGTAKTTTLGYLDQVLQKKWPSDEILQFRRRGLMRKMDILKLK